MRIHLDVNLMHTLKQMLTCWWYEMIQEVEENEETFVIGVLQNNSKVGE